jgi:hypothetical protein
MTLLNISAVRPSAVISYPWFLLDQLHFYANVDTFWAEYLFRLAEEKSFLISLF